MSERHPGPAIVNDNNEIGDAMTKTLVIMTDGTHETRDVPTTYPEFNAAVLDGGYMEVFTVEYMDTLVAFTFDEEGGPMIKDLSPNPLAAELLYRITNRRGALYGTVAVNGLDDQDGFDDVPESVVALLERINHG